MTNHEIALFLRNVAAVYTIKDEKKYHFQISAYQKAAEVIENTITDLRYLLKENKLRDLPGIGPSIKNHLQELLKTGKVKHFSAVMKNIPASIYPLLNIPGFGPKKSFKLVTHFRLNNPATVVDQLEIIAQKGMIAKLEGFGEKSQQDILRTISEFKIGQNKSTRMTLPYANELAEKIVVYLKKSKDVLKIYPLGSLRRKKETIGDVDLAVATKNPEAVISYFIAYLQKDRVLEKGDTTAGLIVSGKHIDLMTMEPDSFGSLLQHFTGSKNHNIHLRELALKQGLSVSEYGIKKANSSKINRFKDEVSFYQALGLQWIPPEIREDTGEIELALKHSLPELINLKDIKGDFHLHSSYPIEPSHDMGQDSMEEMIKKALDLNYQYIGFSEHNPSLSKHNTHETHQILEKRLNIIEKLKEKYKNKLHIFSLLEVDILPSGTLAITDEQTRCLDFMLVSVHSVFNMPKTEMTKRVLKGLSHPKAKILSHPSGRLINQRSGYELDWNQLFDYCTKHNKALEVNAYPSRLDINDELIKQAIAKQVSLVINTDSHAASQMELMTYGVSQAKRGWATKHDILNTREYNDIIKWLKI